MEEKKELIKNLEKSLDAIYQISSKQEEIQSAEDELNALDKKVNDMKVSIGAAFVTLILWLTLIFFSMKLFELLENLEPRLTPLLNSDWSFYICIAFISVLTYYIRKPSRLRREQNAEAYRESQTVILQTDLDLKTLYMQRLIDSDSVKNMQRLIPADYATVDAVTFFITALKNQRADSLKEAINLYETEKHNREMIDMQQQELEMLAQSIELGKAQLDAQQQILEKEKSIAWNQSMTNWRTAKISKQVRFSNAVGIINTVKHWKK